MTFLQDTEFLQELDKLKVRVSYIKLVLLDFNENPIREIQGTATAGSISVNGSSAVRRTLNLTLLAQLVEHDLEDIENEISADKKIRVEKGIKNPLGKYDDILWFPCGLFVISNASISRSTSGWNISITGKDKMCNLDGTTGGLLPSAITFDNYYDENGVEQKVPIPQIIIEAVNHLGGEKLENIIINDIPAKSKMQLVYRGENEILFNENYTSFVYKPEVEEENAVIPEEYTQEIIYGQDVGYKEIPTIYSGELTLNAGEPITNLLNKLVSFLGNFEYFYDLDGKFIFQEKKNYLNTASPLTELNLEHYVRDYSNTKYQYAVTDMSTVSQININPKYENIKNDFTVWGQRETASGAVVDIRYRLVVDAKPDINLANQYMYAIYKTSAKLPEEGQVENYLGLLRYEFSSRPYGEGSVGADETYYLRGRPCQEWREELYRQALVARKDGRSNSVYDEELIAEWRKIYDPCSNEWDNYWNPMIFINPEQINYWLDFIDTGSSLGAYSVNKIGRRAKTVVDTKIKTLYNKQVPDILFIYRKDYKTTDDFNKAIYEYQVSGQKIYPVYENSIENVLFTQQSTEGASCFDRVRELLYQHLSYNTTISITCLPKPYLEPNQLLYINDKDNNINNNYAITQFTIPLTYNGTMSITLTEALKRI